MASLSDSVNLSTACVRDLRSDSDILRPFALRCSRAEIFLLRSASFDKSLFAFRAARGSSNSLTEGTAVLRRMMAVTASRGADWIRACTISLVFSSHASKASHTACASSSFVFFLRGVILDSMLLPVETTVLASDLYLFSSTPSRIGRPRSIFITSFFTRS